MFSPSTGGPAMPTQDIDTLWDYQDPAASEVRFRERLAVAVTEGEPEAFHLEVRTQIARTMSLRRMFDEAHAELDAIELFVRATSEPRLHVRWALEKGRTYNSSGHRSEAIAAFLSAYDVAERHGLDYYTIDAMHMLGIASPVEEALDWNVRAIAMIERTDDVRSKGWLGPLYNNTAWTFFDLGRYDEALALFEKDIALRTDMGGVEQARIARYSKGRVLRALARLDEAEAIQRANLDEIERLQAAADGFVHEEMGELLLARNDEAGARQHLSRAFDLLSADRWISANEPGRLERLRVLAGR